MARVFIDPHMFSVDWFREVLKDLVGSKKVTFLFIRCKKGDSEYERVRAALTFQKLMIQQSRGCEAGEPEIGSRMAFLAGVPRFCNCSHCDDPHIFAAISMKPTKFVFSRDHRIAKCRDEINAMVSKKYCGFIVIPENAVFMTHRTSIL